MSNNFQKARLPFLEHLCLFFIVWGSGTHLSTDYPIALYGLCFSFLFLVLSRGFKHTEKMDITVLIVFLFTILSLCLNTIYYRGEDIGTILKNSVVLLVVLLYVQNNPQRNNLRLDCIVHIILFFSILSNILYVIYMTVGLPKMSSVTLGSSHFYYLLKIAYNTIIGLRMRNSGIYWEPGMYQVYLTFLLIYFLYKPVKRWNSLLITYLIVSVVTTFSVSGYVATAAIMTLYVFSNNSNITARIFTLIVLGLTLIMAFPFLAESFSLKQDTGSYESRSNDLFFGFQVFLKEPILGFGLYNHEYANDSFKFFGVERPDSNGMINLLISTGLVGTLLVTRIMYNSIRFFSRSITKLLVPSLLIWIMISINTEPIVFHQFFYFLMGLGIAYNGNSPVYNKVV